MEVLNAVAAGVPPLGVWRSTNHGEIKSGNKIKAFFKKSTTQSPPSFSNYAQNLFRAIGSQLKNTPVEAPHTILFSSLFGAAPAVSALTYEEALQQGVSSSPTEAPIDIDLNGIIDTVQSFSSENALAIVGGVVLVGVPLVLTRILSTPKTWGTTSAEEAYSKLGEDSDAQLLDIRTLEDIKEVGYPDIRKLKKKAIQITYENDASFLERLSAKFKDPANTILYILDKHYINPHFDKDDAYEGFSKCLIWRSLSTAEGYLGSDRFDGSSAKVAKLVAENGFKSAFAIKDGAEGPRGWQNSGLPWLLPKKAFSVDLGGLTEALGSVIEDSSGLVPVTVGVAAATGVGLAALSEIETVLQLLGSAALIQIFVKKLLFAEDRKVTLQQLQEFLETKVAPKELVDELKEIGKAFLPKTKYEATDNGAAVPDSTPVTALPPTPVTAVSDSMPVTASSNLEVGGNSVPQPEPVESQATPSTVASNSTPKLRPLSPFPHYPDFKPPSSPIPSRP